MPPSRANTSITRREETSVTPLAPTGAARVAPVSQPRGLRDRYINDWRCRLTLTSTPKFLGPTSFSAVYDEHEHSPNHHSSIPSLQLPEFNPSRVQNVICAVDDRQVQLGAEVLSLLFEDFPLYRRAAIAGEEQSSEGIMNLPIIRTLCDIFEEMYNSVSGYLDLNLRWTALSRRLFEGTARQFVTHSAMTYHEYVVLLAGRWEAIGFIFTMFGTCAAHTTVNDPLFCSLDLSAADHKNLGILAIAGGDMCLQFCDFVGVRSEALGWLLLRHIHLLTMVCGDADFRPRKRLAELSALIFDMGYHQLDTCEYLPFFLAEGRKRLLVTAYACDKALATFLGFPPLISYRYCRIQLPLDLEPNEVIAEPALREAAICKLDHNGWNTKGLIKGTSWSRVAMKLGHVRELILELSFGSLDQNVQQSAETISSLFQQIRSRLPSYMTWDESTESVLRLTSTMPIYIHLDLLYSNFLLQRILVKRSLAGPEILASLAHQILKAVIAHIAIQQRCGNPFSELGWTIPYFGLPSAGILVIELLRQTQKTHLQPTKELFPRSEVIQNLSILASHIQYIHLPQNGNYEICQQARKVIVYILDHLLSKPTEAPTSASPVPSNIIPTDWLSEEWLNDGSEFITWIDGLDWNE
ncbi:Ribosome biogenesis protein ERB1 [Talaromyces islandicus]|uniref:Ribosome biogenesis protein ERB1 n=1 Tax=Talaromyces islandicus TaxID=28573 RepID=A0A0U1MB31_TALIS|nr:Ribosome biogenesis protein ERB1 [Talaromyces islandicus]